jgi:hypothetical protein
MREMDKRELRDGSYYSDAESAANESYNFDCNASVEIKGLNTHSGNPEIFDVKREWFDSEEIEQ